MTVKRTNTYLLITVILGVAFNLGLSTLFNGLPHSSEISTVVNYLIMFGIGLLFLKRNNMTFKEALPYHVPMKFTTALCVVGLWLCIQPVMNTLAEIGGRLFGTTVFETASAVYAEKTTGFWTGILATALVPAVFEEMLYRGFLYGGYKKGSGAFRAILLTSFLFGSFHMIPQQMVYAMGAGIVLAYLRELTGSMWPGMLLHFLNNGMSPVSDAIKQSNPEAEKFLFESYLGFDTMTNTVITLVATVVGVILIYFLLKEVAHIEGREEDFRTNFRNDKGENLPLISASLVVAFGIEVLFMVGVTVFFNMVPADTLQTMLQ